jgi:hypothetical protein
MVVKGELIGMVKGVKALIEELSKLQKFIDTNRPHLNHMEYEGYINQEKSFIKQIDEAVEAQKYQKGQQEILGTIQRSGAMKFNPKTAAESLIKIAETLEKEAADNTYFVCSKCNHTATLASINDRRVRTAKERNVKNVNAVTVNDKVSCPACEGVMTYAPTEDSAKYYVEAAEQPLEIAPPSETPGTEPAPMSPPEEEEPKKKTPKDPNSPFAPVDEQEGEELDLGFGDEDVDKPEEGAPEDKPPMGMGSPEETGTPPEGEGIPEDKPMGEDKPEGAPEGDVPPPEGEPPAPEGEIPEEGKEPKEEEPPVVEETVPGEDLGDMPPEPKKPGRKKKEKVEFPKSDGPKFEKMPKDASDMEYQAAINKYLF